MKAFVLCTAVFLAAAAGAADIKVDLKSEQVGKAPLTFEPMVGTWVVAQDGGDRVIMIDGRPWVASKNNPTKLLLQTARKLYGASNEELMDNAKQFAYYPVAVLKSVDTFSNGTISLKFKTIAGDADRASGILFNVKPNGDWLAVRYNDTENNVALWEFHNGIRRNLRFSDRAHHRLGVARSYMQPALGEVEPQAVHFIHHRGRPARDGNHQRESRGSDCRRAHRRRSQ